MSATILPFVRPPTDAVMSLQCQVPEDAMTAPLLGTRRESHAVQVSEDGLLLTVGYSVLEAAEITLRNRRGQTGEAVVLAHDFDSGIALLKPTVPLGSTWIEWAPLSTLRPGEETSVLTGESDRPLPATVFAIEEFAGRWEYLLEEAIYTIPLCEHWSGAALLNRDGKLCGIGSLAIGLGGFDGKVVPGNLFIPVELVAPHLQHMALHGETPQAKRPWLGILAEEHEAELFVVGVYADAPACNAGIKPGDVILSVRRQPVASLAGLFRSLWRLGPAGARIPLTIRDEDGTREVVLHSTDRNSFFIRRESAPIN